MTKQAVRWSIGFALLVVLTLPLAPPAFSDQSTEVEHIARWAVLLGHRDPGVGAANADSGASDELIDWDFRRDDAELLEMFELVSIETLQHGRHRFSGATTESSITAGRGESKVEIEATVGVEMFDGESGSIPAFRCRFVIRRGDEVLSAPMVVSELGQRAIVASGADDGQTILYIVMDVDRVPKADK